CLQWARRHPTATALVTAGLLAATLLLGSGGAFALRLQVERDRVARQREEAVTNFRLACQAVNTYFTKVSANERLQEVDLRPLRKELLEAAKVFYDQVVREHSGDPDVLSEQGRIYRYLGLLTQEIASKSEAIALYQHSVAIFEGQ